MPRRAETTLESSGGSTARVIALLTLVPVLGVAIFVAGLAAGVRDTDVTMLGLAVITLVVGLVPLIVDQRLDYPDRHLFLSLLLIIFMAHYVVPAFAYYLPAVGPVTAPAMAGSNLLPQHVVYGQIVALIGLCSLMIGYSSPVSRAIGRAAPRFRHDWSQMALIGVALIMIPLGWLITIGSVFGLLPPVGMSVIGALSLSYYYANVLLTLAIYRHRSGLAIVILVANLAASFLYGLITSDKGQMLIAPAVVVLTWILLTGRIRAWWVLSGFLALAVVYPVSIFVRLDLGAGWDLRSVVADPGATIGQISSFVSEARPGQYLLDGMLAAAARTDGLGVTSVIARDTPSVSPFQWGRTIALFFVTFVPRFLWPGKPPTSIGQWITDIYGSGPQTQSSTGPTQLADWYLNFGIPGVIVGMALLGALMRIVHESLIRGRMTAPSMMIVVVFFYYLAVKFMGNVAAVLTNIVFSVVPILLTHFFLRQFLHVTFEIPESPGPDGRGGAPSEAQVAPSPS